jgi:hypothetical protein
MLKTVQSFIRIPMSGDFLLTLKESYNVPNVMPRWVRLIGLGLNVVVESGVVRRFKSIEAKLIRFSGHNKMDDLCYDLTEFKQWLKEARRMEDNIIPQLNALTTKDKAACDAFQRSIKASHQSRKAMIHHCTELLTQRLSNLIVIDSNRSKTGTIETES